MHIPGIDVEEAEVNAPCGDGVFRFESNATKDSYWSWTGPHYHWNRL